MYVYHVAVRLNTSSGLPGTPIQQKTRTVRGRGQPALGRRAASQLASLKAVGRPAVCRSGLAWELFIGQWGSWLGLLDGCSMIRWSTSRLSGLLAQLFSVRGLSFFQFCFLPGL